MAQKRRREMERVSTALYEEKTDRIGGKSLKPMNSLVTPLLTDWYQISMAYAYFVNGTHRHHAVFDLFFRKNPFHGEYTIFAGLEEVIRYLDDFKFTKSDVDYIKGRLPPGAKTDEFCAYLQGLNCSEIQVYAIKEGTVVFPRVPLLRVEGPIITCQLLETTMLTLLNFPSLVATNAARHVKAARGKAVLEFGLRRAQGPDGGMSASRYSYMGGCSGTSNVLAGLLFNLDVKGTMAHSYVTSFVNEGDMPNKTLVTSDGREIDFWAEVMRCRSELGFESTNPGELVAFTSYARAFPSGFLALVDTYDTLKSGVPNFLCVCLALHRAGYKGVGIRLDSGDLAFLSKKVRLQFESAAKTTGLEYLEKMVIVASNDLNEATLHSLYEQSHEIDAFGIGTNLVTCEAQPALGCVYKLVEIEGTARIKLSQDPVKITLPGRKDAYRLYTKSGEPVVDLMVLATPSVVDEVLPEAGHRITACHPSEEHKRVHVIPNKVEKLLNLVFDKGKKVYDFPSLDQTRTFVSEQLRVLRPDYTRPLNPTPYKVSLSERLIRFVNELRRENTVVSEIS